MWLVLEMMEMQGTGTWCSPGAFFCLSSLQQCCSCCWTVGLGLGQSLVSGGGDTDDTSRDKGCHGRVGSCALQDVLSCRAGRACSGQAGHADRAMQMCLCCRTCSPCHACWHVPAQTSASCARSRRAQLSPCGWEQSSGLACAGVEMCSAFELSVQRCLMDCDGQDQRLGNFSV